MRKYLTAVVESLVENLKSASLSAALLSDSERRVAALFFLAGDDARVDWVRAAADLGEEEFLEAVGRLESLGILVLDHGVRGERVMGLAVDENPPLSSMFSQSKIREIALTLARSMEASGEDSPHLKARLARLLVKAGMSGQALDRFSEAAAAFATRRLWDEAASQWHQAAVIARITGAGSREVSCLCEAVKCLCEAGRLDVAEELGERAYKVACDPDSSYSAPDICNVIGSALILHDPNRAAAWYRRGVDTTDVSTTDYPVLLSGLVKCDLVLGRSESATRLLRDLEDWLSRFGSNDVTMEAIEPSYYLLSGWSASERRCYVKAKADLGRFLEQEPGQDRYTALARQYLGAIMLSEDRVEEARELVEEAALTLKSTGPEASWASAAVDLARISLRDGDLLRASTLLDEALPSLASVPGPRAGLGYLVRAAVRRASGRLRVAIRDGRKAVEILRSCEERDWDLSCAAYWLSRCFSSSGDSERARFYENWAFRLCSKKKRDVADLFHDCSLLEPKTIGCQASSFPKVDPSKEAARTIFRRC